MNTLTIVLSSFNRKQLLKRAFESCKHQTSRDFDLIIFDDMSTDGAREYLLSVQHDPAITTLILNDNNIGFSRSINQALQSVQTEWATILCDDDFLDPHFVEHSLDTLRSTCRDCVVVGFNYVDANGQVVHTFCSPQQSLGGQEAFLNSGIPVAGISGFFFRAGGFPGQDLMRDYPRAFFSDTFLIAQIVLDNGLETIAEALYNKTIWDESESSLDTRSTQQFFEAMLRYNHDLDALLEQHGFDLQFRLRVQKPMSLRHFAYVLISPIVARDSITGQDIANMFAIARRYDQRYIPHCLLFAMSFPLANRWTLGIRRQLHRLYRRINGRPSAK